MSGDRRWRDLGDVPARPCCVLHGTTKHRSHGTSPGCVPALRFLAPQLWLYSFILSDDSLMLRHFLSHYQGLGVWANQSRFGIRVRRRGRAEELQATLAVLREYRIPDSNYRLLHTAPSDEVKLAMVNQHLERLPKGAYSVYADVDELFDYPCELEGAVRRGKDCISGAMVDQLSAGGNITEMTAEPDLAIQYPLQCRIREAVVPHLQSSKIILHRVDGRACKPGDTCGRMTFQGFRTTHAVAEMPREDHLMLPEMRVRPMATNGSWTRCAVRGIVRHYTMTTKQLLGNAEKATQHDEQPASGAGQPPVPGLVLNYANATCGHLDPKSGKCLDYALLHDFMRDIATGARSPRCSGSLKEMGKGVVCSRENPWCGL